MKSQQIKNSFQSGVLSPRLSLRSDLEKYLSALENCTNFIVNPQGGIIFRQGFEDITEVPFTSAPARIFQFHKGGDESDMVMLVSAGDSSIRFYIDGVVQPDVLTHDYLQSELDELYFTNQEVTGVLCHASHPPYYIDIALDGSISGAPLPSSNVPFADYSDANSPTASLSASDTYTCTWEDTTTTAKWLPATEWVFSYDGIFAVGRQGNRKIHPYDSNSETMIKKLVKDMSLITQLRGVDTQFSVLPVGVPDDTNIYAITILGPNAGKEIRIAPFDSQLDCYVNVVNEMTEDQTTEPAWSYPTYVVHNGIYYQCILSHTPELVTNEPPNSTYWIDLGATKPDTYDWQYPDVQLNGTVTVAAGTPNVVGTDTAFIADPVTIGSLVIIEGETHTVAGISSDTVMTLATNHVAGATDALIYNTGNPWLPDIPGGRRQTYSPGGRGFPTVAVVHQQRMLLMANPGFTMGVFGSRINNYKDFARGPEDDDPFFFAIDTSDTPTIKWAESQQHLIFGTSSGDYSVAANVTLTPSDVQIEKQNNARSNASRAVTVNTEVFYVEQGREKMRASSFIDDMKARSSFDISLIAENLLHERAVRVVLMQTPEVVLFILRDDGSLTAISYSHENQMGAWYEFESQGVLVDICVGYTTRLGYPVDDPERKPIDEDELWGVVTYDGGATHWLERMPYPSRTFYVQESEDEPTLTDQGVVLLDGWLQGEILEGDNNVIQGLDQYEGLTVACLVEDAYTGEYFVNSGAIILDTEDSQQNYEGQWIVGLSYVGFAKTFEMSAGQRAGTAIGTPRRWNKLIIKTLDSALPIINGELPPDRNPETLMGIPEIIQEGLQARPKRDLGWGDGSITIEQDRPYPTNVIGFVGEFNTNFAG